MKDDEPNVPEAAFNEHRAAYPGRAASLADAELSRANLRAANLRSAILHRASLRRVAQCSLDAIESDLSDARIR